jgi:hypothetical protein
MHRKAACSSKSTNNSPGEIIPAHIMLISSLLAFQTLLDAAPQASEQRVEMTTLRKLCSRGGPKPSDIHPPTRTGIPHHPTHLRELSYLLLLDVLPADKRAWKTALKQQRETYYVRYRHALD